MVTKKKKKNHEPNKRKRVSKKFVSKDHKNALITSYKISFQKAWQGEAQTIAKNLAKPCTTALIDSMIELCRQYVALSNSTV